MEDLLDDERIRQRIDVLEQQDAAKEKESIGEDKTVS